ncbi:MAG: leucine-rich repeat domain-containing protein, partial [Promethearchaeota archaeon]
MSFEGEIKDENIILFRGVKILKNQAEVLLEIEKEAEKEFSVVEKTDIFTEMGVSIRDNNIIEIGLYKCGLSRIPESIGNLKSLETLNLYYNKLKKLPESIGNLKSLRYLYLHYNKLEELPESIGNLTKLIIL